MQVFLFEFYLTYHPLPQLIVHLAKDETAIGKNFRAPNGAFASGKDDAILIEIRLYFFRADIAIFFFNYFPKNIENILVAQSCRCCFFFDQKISYGFHKIPIF